MRLDDIIWHLGLLHLLPRDTPHGDLQASDIVLSLVLHDPEVHVKVFVTIAFPIFNVNAVNPARERVSRPRCPRWLVPEVSFKLPAAGGAGSTDGSSGRYDSLG